MEDSQSTLSAMSPQPADEDLEMCNPPPRRRPIGFLHLPFELRRKIYQYFIPRNYEVWLDDGSLRWAKNDYWVRLKHPFHNILRVSKRVSEESLDILYGDNTFVTNWEEGEDPFLDILTENNRDRIGSERWQLICNIEDLGDRSYLKGCEVSVTICRGSIRVYLEVYDDLIEEMPMSLVFWNEEFLPRLRAVLEMSVPQSTMTKVFLETDPVFVDWMMDDVKEIFDVYLTKGYETWRL